MDDDTRAVNRRTTLEADARAADLRFVTRGISDEEAAAVTAVVLAAIDEGAGAASVAEPVPDRWVRSGNALRTPFPVGPGNWSHVGR